MVQADTRRPVAEAVVGTRTPVIRANGAGIGLTRIGRRTISMAFGDRLWYGATPTLFGEAPTCPTATTVTGGRCGILTQNGEARMEAGVIPKAFG